MDKLVQCNFVIIRFMPYVETEEFVNLGVALACPDLHWFGFKLEMRRIDRITDFFPELKGKSQMLTEGRKVFHEELCRIGTLLNERAQGQRQLHSSEDARMFNTMFLNLVHPRRGVFCFSQPKACLSANPAEEVEKLFDCYVSRNKEHFFVMPQENENGILDFASSVQ